MNKNYNFININSIYNYNIHDYIMRMSDKSIYKLVSMRYQVDTGEVSLGFGNKGSTHYLSLNELKSLYVVTNNLNIAKVLYNGEYKL